MIPNPIYDPVLDTGEDVEEAEPYPANPVAEKDGLRQRHLPIWDHETKGFWCWCGWQSQNHTKAGQHNRRNKRGG